MIKLISVFFLMASTTQAAQVLKSKTNSIEIKTENKAVVVYLPKGAYQALTQWNPEFLPFNRSDYSQSVLELFADVEQPMTFIDDLDGNGKKDIVLLGNDLTNQYAVAILQKDKNLIS